MYAFMNPFETLRIFISISFLFFSFSLEPHISAKAILFYWFLAKTISYLHYEF